MRLIARKTLVAFATLHPSSLAALTIWQRRIEGASWKTMSDIQTAFPKAKVLNGERVRFEIQGGDFRLIASFDFPRQIAFIKFIGTHADDDRVDALTVSRF
jgi:mRNA interferase HigB